MPIILVWYYNNLLEEWRQKTTNELVGSLNEQKYFKAIVDGIKQYYNSSNDYLNHRKNDINLLFDYKMDKLDSISNPKSFYDLYTLNNKMINQIVTEV